MAKIKGFKVFRPDWTYYEVSFFCVKSIFIVSYINKTS